ncbi:CCR4-NOT transcription complex subunit 6 [Melipona quadrifasciata]|uniref:CCR4-NOT transcription complex subunit 6 n=1 Tax=Melipona quadrifasciata TaxID=166423 RepID=A0A0M9A7H2_9HYME|nr:CCR4-NOT transcription complex subunit 6 [Melipona quadrifasciata]
MYVRKNSLGYSACISTEATAVWGINTQNLALTQPAGCGFISQARELNRKMLVYRNCGNICRNCGYKSVYLLMKLELKLIEFQLFMHHEDSRFLARQAKATPPSRDKVMTNNLHDARETFRSTIKELQSGQIRNQILLNYNQKSLPIIIGLKRALGFTQKYNKIVDENCFPGVKVESKLKLIAIWICIVKFTVTTLWKASQLNKPFELPPSSDFYQDMKILRNEQRRGSSGSQLTANHPPQRPWIPLTRPNRTRPTCKFFLPSEGKLSNLFGFPRTGLTTVEAGRGIDDLGNAYATRQMYGYCPSWALDWEYRKKGILDEIRHYAADIISLQEVETDQFYNFFLPELKHDGYDGIFSPKSRAKTMAENDRKYVDGCAIFYRTAKFTLIKEHLVEFNQLAMANAEGSDNMLNRVMPKDNIGLAALLRTKEAAWDNEYHQLVGCITITMYHDYNLRERTYLNNTLTAFVGEYKATILENYFT